MAELHPFTGWPHCSVADCDEEYAALVPLQRDDIGVYLGTEIARVSAYLLMCKGHAMVVAETVPDNAA